MELLLAVAGLGMATLLTGLDGPARAAVTAGVANWLSLRRLAGSRAAAQADAPALPGRLSPAGPLMAAGDDGGHTIYLDPWAGEVEGDAGRGAAVSDHGPSALP